MCHTPYFFNPKSEDGSYAHDTHHVPLETSLSAGRALPEKKGGGGVWSHYFAAPKLELLLCLVALPAGPRSGPLHDPAWVHVCPGQNKQQNIGRRGNPYTEDIELGGQN
jgi:hypothetical protein